MDEEVKKNQVAEETKQSALHDPYTTARANAINQMYDAQKSSREAELKSAYDQSVSGYNAAQEKLKPSYLQQNNDLSAQYERNRRNFNQQAVGNGINTGTGSQAALARESQFMRAMGGLKQSEAEQNAEYERRKTDLLAQYQSNVAKAGADTEFGRAGALLNEYDKDYNRNLKAAETLANYGDFSGYRSLYGDAQADAMFQLWIAANPDLAYNTGRITRDQYRVMVGKDPAGWTATGGVTVNDLVDGMIPNRAKTPVSSGGSGMSADAAYREAIGWGSYDPRRPQANTKSEPAAPQATGVNVTDIMDAYNAGNIGQATALQLIDQLKMGNG